MSRTIRNLGILITGLAFIVSLVSIINPSIYKDNEFVTSVWFGNDIVTLIVAIPLLILCIRKAYISKEVPLKTSLMWLGCLWYMIYNYIYYAYGAAYNSFFILYILIIALSFVSLFLLFAQIYSHYGKQIESRLRGTSVKGFGIFMLVFAMFIGGMWITMILIGLLKNELPMGIEQTGHPTSIVFATDLLFLVTPLISLGILVLRGNVVAIILSYGIMIKCILYPIVLAIAGVTSYMSNGSYDTMTPLYLILGLICFVQLLGLNKKIA